MKLVMKNPIVEIDGDEMAHVLWALIKEKLLLPFVDLNTEYYDLSIENRERTSNTITSKAARAILNAGVGVKCATITANTARKAEYNLSTLYPSPNATIRALLDGTVFRKPIITSRIKPAIRAWKKPVIIARHAYGDVYAAVEMVVPKAGKVELVYTPNDGSPQTHALVSDFKSPGIVQSIHNIDDSIRNFAHACFKVAADENMPLWFATKDTISKTYDGRFKAIFAQTAKEYPTIEYPYSLIDDMVARVMRSPGGFVWACKNYDGDVFSDMVASASGCLAMMTSVLVSPAGVYEYEAAHGTVQRHYYRYKAGEKTSTNPVALIFAWTGALARRGIMDGGADGTALQEFAANLEHATLGVIDDGLLTGDLIAATDDKQQVKPVNSWEFIDAVAARLR
jgi:isocitrate dehydrogenase